LTAILFLSSMIEKSSINTKSFVDVKWCLNDTTNTIDTIESASLCFKKDKTFWHYRTRNLLVDSFMFSNWGVENNKLYLFDNTLSQSKFAFMRIVSCNEKYMIIEDLKKKELVKFRKKNNLK